MKTSFTALLSAWTMAGLLATSAAFGQSSGDVAGIKKDIEALKEGQQAIQKDLQEIKKLLTGRPAAGAPGVDQAMNALVDVAGEPTKGDVNAKLTLVEFSEYQCPFCGRHVRDVFPAIDKDYIQTGKARYVFKDLPLESIHKNAFKAAEAAHCAGEQKKYWEMHDRLFANQNSLEPAMLTAHAEAVGLDSKKFQACLDSGKFAAEIRKDMAEATKYGITGTPTTVIGTTQPDGKVKVARVIRGAQAYNAFKAALDELLSTPSK